MERKNLYRDNKRVVDAVFRNGELLYTITYFFDADLSVCGRVAVYSDGKVIVSGDVDVIKEGD